MSEKDTKELKELLSRAPVGAGVAGKNILEDLIERTPSPTNHGQTSHVQTGHGQSPHNKSFSKS
jgi:hypothetical protein